jgi:hypothetical protein
VKRAISRLCNYSSNQLRVRRKTKVSTTNNRSTWWFVLHDKEEQLTELEGSWDALQLQTQWKIEPCYMPASISLASNSETQESSTDRSATPREPENDTNTSPPEHENAPADPIQVLPDQDASNSPSQSFLEQVQDTTAKT